jgi:hypothetical protein
VLLAVAFLGGCTDTTDTGGTSLGRIIVRASDQNNAGVPDLMVDLRLANGQTIWRTARTGADGTAEFGASEGGVLLQNYIVRIRLTLQWQLATGESNDKPVTPVAGQTVTVEFKVAPSSTGGT